MIAARETAESVTVLHFGFHTAWDRCAEGKFHHRVGGGIGILDREEKCVLVSKYRHIERHFASSISLTELARLTDMSVTHFRREWKKHYHITPLEYRNSIRLSFARELILSGYYTVSEITEKCGFDDIDYFIRFFKKHTGIMPFKYKQQLF